MKGLQFSLYKGITKQNSLIVLVQSDMDNPRESFVFKEITLLKSKALGAGSYGRVCKATCDTLPCAAKIIHPTLFDLNDPGAASFKRKFDDECRLLSKVRHPNIVLYLATYSDPETTLPVLLMELCDESLTKFLERSSGPLAYHTEVNITHDIALALVYLHSNEVIHRDLTSNNVLMIAGTRAKVTDFGMSKLVSVDPRTLTKCPGNVLYMSPEALDEVPHYTNQLDIFSLGVLVVQILTRTFPNPKPRFEVVDVSNDPRFGNSSVRVPVAETERRSEHIRLIDDGHPLKKLALNCLQDDEILRPSALELSTVLQDMKESEMYTESMFPSGEETSSRAKITSLRKQVQHLKLQDKDHRQKMTQQQKEFEAEKQQELQEKANEVLRLQTALGEKEKMLKATQHAERELKATIEMRERELRASQELLAQVQQKLQLKENTIIDLHRAMVTSSHQPQPAVRESGGHVREISQASGGHVGLSEGHVGLSRASGGHVGLGEGHVGVSQESGGHVGLGGGHVGLSRASGGHVGLGEGHVGVSQESGGHVGLNRGNSHTSHITMRFDGNTTAPYSVARGAAVVSHNTAFINPEATNRIYQITKGVNHWIALPDHPYVGFGLAVIDNSVTTIGGWDQMTFTNQLLTLNSEQRWMLGVYPSMPTPRTEGAVVSSKNLLVVAGGYDGHRMLSTVEVLTFFNMQWATASPMPYPFYMACGSLCGDQLYLAGGYVEGNVKSRSVLTCSLVNLLHSLPGSIRTSGVWREASQLPFTKSTLVSQGGRLLAVGGKDEAGQAKSGILMYDPYSASWSHIGDSIINRSQCFALAFPGEVIYIIGGDPKNYSIEMMSVVESGMRL